MSFHCRKRFPDHQLHYIWEVAALAGCSGPCSQSPRLSVPTSSPWHFLHDWLTHKKPEVMLDAVNSRGKVPDCLRISAHDCVCNPNGRFCRLNKAKPGLPSGGGAAHPLSFRFCTGPLREHSSTIHACFSKLGQNALPSLRYTCQHGSYLHLPP
jgi:hypothetical protein